MQESCTFWMELCTVLVAQHAVQLAWVCVVHSSLCLHQQQRKLLTKPWQTCACDPSTGLACTGLLHGVVSQECCVLFSNMVKLADVLAMGSATHAFSAALWPTSAESHKDFDNHAG